jgi:hypothetical protein
MEPGIQFPSAGWINPWLLGHRRRGAILLFFFLPRIAFEGSIWTGLFGVSLLQFIASILVISAESSARHQRQWMLIYLSDMHQGYLCGDTIARTDASPGTGQQTIALNPPTLQDHLKETR